MKYKQGDILWNEVGNERKVLGVCGEAYILSCFNRFNKANILFTQHDIDNDNLVLKPERSPDGMPTLQ